MQLQKRAVEHVGLDDKRGPDPSTRLLPKFFDMPPRKALPPPPATRLNQAAIVVVVVLPVRAGNGHHVLSLRNRAEQPRALDDLETAVAKEAQLRMIFGDRRRIDDQRIVAAAEAGRYRVGRLVIGHFGALAPQLGRQLRRRAVIAGHAPAFVQKIARLGAHADSAYAQK